MSKRDFYLGCFIGHQWMRFIASLGDFILLLCHKGEIFEGTNTFKAYLSFESQQELRI